MMNKKQIGCTAVFVLLISLMLAACGNARSGQSAVSSLSGTASENAVSAQSPGTEDASITGIIGAMDEEVQSLEEHLTDKVIVNIAGMEFCTGTFSGHEVVVVKCNIGKVNAGICAQLLIEDFHVDRIINTGVAGSLDAKIDIGDIVISKDAVQHDYDLTPLGMKPGEFMDFGVTAFPADAAMQESALKAVSEVAPEIHAFVGRVCSGDQFIASKAQKQKILDNFGGLCCEMEGGAIAQVCYVNKTPFVIIRAISDKADDSEEISYETFKKSAAARCAAITEYMVSHLE